MNCCAALRVRLREERNLRVVTEDDFSSATLPLSTCRGTGEHTCTTTRSRLSDRYQHTEHTAHMGHGNASEDNTDPHATAGTGCSNESTGKPTVVGGGLLALLCLGRRRIGGRMAILAC